MPEAVLNEFLTLREHPELNPARYHEIIDKWWGISFSSPSIASSDWLTVGVLVLVTIPFIAYFGLVSCPAPVGAVQPAQNSCR